MGNPAKRKGTDAENAVRDYLRGEGWNADRAPSRGTKDRGDIDGIPGVTIEVKNNRGVDLAGWVKELEREMGAGGNDAGAVITKRRGSLQVGTWYAIMPVNVLVHLLKEAGY